VLQNQTARKSTYAAAKATPSWSRNLASAGEILPMTVPGIQLAVSAHVLEVLRTDLEGKPLDTILWLFDIARRDWYLKNVVGLS
jgi:hypothetical protein